MYEKVLILEKALEVFAEKGYYRTTIEEVANRTNLKKTTIYRCIKSKEDLFVELLTTASAARKREVFDQIDITGDVKEKLSRFTLSYIRFARNQRNYHKILNMEVPSENPEFEATVKKIGEQFKQVIYQILQDGIRQGIFRMVNPLIVSVFLEKLTEGVLDVVETEPNYSPDQIVLSMLDLIWNGLVKK